MNRCVPTVMGRGVAILELAETSQLAASERNAMFSSFVAQGVAVPIPY